MGIKCLGCLLQRMLGRRLSSPRAFCDQWLSRCWVELGVRQRPAWCVKVTRQQPQAALSDRSRLATTGRPAHVPPAAGGAERGGLPRGGRRAAAASWGALQPQDAQQSQEERRARPGRGGARARERAAPLQARGAEASPLHPPRSSKWSWRSRDITLSTIHSTTTSTTPSFAAATR